MLNDHGVGLPDEPPRVPTSAYDAFQGIVNEVVLKIGSRFLNIAETIGCQRIFDRNTVDCAYSGKSVALRWDKSADNDFDGVVKYSLG